MAAADPHRRLSTTLGISADELSRAFHNLRLLIDMDLPISQRQALLAGLYDRAQQTVPEMALLERLLSQGPRLKSLSGLRSGAGMDDDQLRALALALGDPDLAAHMVSLLQQITGVAAAISPEAAALFEEQQAASEAVAAALATAAAALEAAATAAFDAALDREAAGWDVVFCAYDPVARRHRLTLLRSGAWLDGPEVAADAEWGAPEPSAEWLYEDALSAPLSTEVMENLLAYTRPFQTPPVPDREGLLAQLRAAQGPLAQVYWLEVRHGFPSPSGVSAAFWFREAGERGREQRLSRTLRVEPLGLGLEGAEATLSSRWDTPARLRIRGSERRYTPRLLTVGEPSGLPMAGGWQARLRWSLSLQPLLAEGPTLPITADLDLRGRAAVSGAGHLQEQMAATCGMAAAIYGGMTDATAQCLRTSGDPSQAAEEGGGIGWTAGVASGVGTLTVHVGDLDQDLSALGVQVATENRPIPGIPPRISEEVVWADERPAAPLEGDRLSLEGGVVIEQTVRLEDALQAAQSTAQVGGTAHLSSPLVLSVAGHHLQITLSSEAGEAQETPLPPPEGAEATEEGVVRLEEVRVERVYPWAGTIAVEGAPRWRLRWRSRVERASVAWPEEIDLVSGGADGLGASPEVLRDGVVAHHRVQVSRVAGGYWLEAEEPDDNDEG